MVVLAVTVEVAVAVGTAVSVDSVAVKVPASTPPTRLLLFPLLAAIVVRDPVPEQMEFANRSNRHTLTVTTVRKSLVVSLLLRSRSWGFPYNIA